MCSEKYVSEIQHLQTGAAEISGLLGYDGGLFSKWLPCFEGTQCLHLQGSSSPRIINLGQSEPMIQHHKPKDLNPQQNVH
jgi:hypothetical protein